MPLDHTSRAPSALPFHLLVSASAFLLFTLELMIGRRLLPLFGSSASVWTTCLMFYQGALFLGYLYADHASRWIARGRYRYLHLWIPALAALVMPFRLISLEIPPMLAVVVALLLSIFLPFVALSTTSVIAQAFFARTQHPGRDNPYPLYASSNAGALLALLVYPFVVEPLLELSTQLLCWYVLYGVFVLVHLPCLAAVDGKLLTPEPASESPPKRLLLRWLLLSAGANALLMAVTHVVTLDAPVPMLWVGPLFLYLLTLVITFGRRPPSRENIARTGLLAMVVAVVALLFLIADVHRHLATILVHNMVLFAGCLQVHGRLAAARPQRPGLLGPYFLAISLGGWVGALLLGVIMPLVTRRLPFTAIDYLAAGLLILSAFLMSDTSQPPSSHSWRKIVLGSSLALGLLLGGGLWLRQAMSADVHGSRTFYGIYRVVDQGEMRLFHHGNTVHGAQWLAPARAMEPTSYYSRTSPVSEVLAEPESGPRIGVVGLGAGVLALYAKEGQHWTFFELDPEVAEIAQNHFSFLRNAAVVPEIIIGDGRLALEALPDASFDLLVLDVFSSDAVPLHMLTREALELYLQKLEPGGVLLFHISSRLFDLETVLRRLAHGLGAQMALKEGKAPDPPVPGIFKSRWVVISRDPSRLSDLETAHGWTEPATPLKPAKAWTDEYINLFHALEGF